MRIINIAGPSHRNDGPSFYYERTFNQIPDVTCERKTVLQPPDTWGEYDMPFYVDWAADALDVPDFRFPPNTFYIASDAHCSGANFLYRYLQAEQARIACVNQWDVWQQFAHLGVKNVCWLPHAVDHTVYTPILKDYSVPRAHLAPDAKEWEEMIVRAVPRYDVAWVGFIRDANRRVLLDQMFKAFPNFTCRVGDTFFESAAKAYGYSKLAINLSLRGDLNMRTMEVLATRTCLLTDEQMGMRDLGLLDGVNCVIYNTLDEAIEKANWYIAHDAAREQIAETGYRWVLANHCYFHRAKAVLDLYKKLVIE